jgi:hypothetical protein
LAKKNDPLPFAPWSAACGAAATFFMTDGLAELENDHEDADEQQDPGCANHDPHDLSGDIHADQQHEYGEYDQEPQRIDQVVQKSGARDDRLNELDDPQARLMGKEINEGENVVQDLVQGFEIGCFENK